jgi:hypothetical protein
MLEWTIRLNRSKGGPSPIERKLARRAVPFLKANAVKIADKQLSVVTTCALMYNSWLFIAIYLLEPELVMEVVSLSSDFKLEVLRFEIEPLGEL